MTGWIRAIGLERSYRVIWWFLVLNRLNQAKLGRFGLPIVDSQHFLRIACNLRDSIIGRNSLLILLRVFQPGVN